MKAPPHSTSASNANDGTDLASFLHARYRQLGTWLLGLLILAGVILMVLRLGEIERITALARQARPAWLLIAVLMQVLTYVCAAAVWDQTLRRAGQSRLLASLIPLGLAKLFTDQMLPSGGMSGTLLVMRGLARRGIPARSSMAALLVGLISYYAAYSLAVLFSLVSLWASGMVHPALLGAVAIFSLLAAGVPIALLSLKQLANSAILHWLTHLPGMAQLVAIATQAPINLLRQPALLVKTTGLQLTVFLLDGTTFWAVLRSIGTPASPAAVFSSFIMASVAATIGLLPLGLGTFEAVAVTLLHMQGVPLGAALTATLLLRGLTLWLPMLPGLWLARRELRQTGDTV